MSRSALILAGGRGRRLGFREKALITIKGKPLIDFVIERTDGYFEPLCAVYNCNLMMRDTKKSLDAGENTILAPIFRLNVNYVPVEEIRKIDPDLKTFININTFEDLEKIY